MSVHVMMKKVYKEEVQQMKKNMIFILLMFVAISVAACSHSEQQGREHGEKAPSELKQKQLKQTITLAAIGDILIHESVYETAREKKEYNFIPYFQYVKPYLQKVDIGFANQESMIGGSEIGLSTYPAFNSPHEVGDALKDVGIDIVSMANNHTLDRGEKAILHAIRHWEKIGMMYVGSYKSQEDRDNLRVIETPEGISVAFLAYTYGTNGIPVPTGKDYLVNLIQKDVIERDIKEAKEKADVVVVSYHFGIEYERMPSEEQRDLVQFAADQGARLVLGHHPHVLQPIEWVEGKDGHQTLAIYSLGNFLSGQIGLERQIGGIFQCEITKTFEKDASHKIEIHSPAFMPTFVHVNEWKPRPMFQLTDDDLPQARQHYEEVKQHMNQFVPDLQFIEE